nr:malonyl CoA-acyl carrier protein transacylase [Myxococcales bacterium]
MSTRNLDIPVNVVQDDEAPPPSGLSSMQRAILTIQRMRAKIEGLERARTEPIAIIGMACRFPGGADTPEAYFELLEKGVDTIGEAPAERWDEGGRARAADAEARALRWGSFLQGVDLFDAAFFGIAPREAESLDPQQRLLLEVTWEALERAGQLPERLMGSRTGVFVGIWSLDYQQNVLGMSQDELDAYCFTGNVLSTAAGRLSYVLGLQGPCMSVETACSSSLVAMHLACQSLRNGESNLALAGGVNLLLSPTTTRLLSKTQALSQDGRCKTFDAQANGFVRGEGCGMLVLKRLSDAQRDRDPIIALLRGSATNQDGRSTGLTAPNVLSQQALLRQALENARVAPSDIGYVETHGTGTALGDPIEVEALKEVLGGPREEGATCVLGAVKTNIGHLESAAGVAGVIKAALALQNQRIPPNLHFRTLNPRIKLEGTPFVIPRQVVPWGAGTRPRFAGVSSFGISGTNAHVILEEAPANVEEDLTPEDPCYLLPLSAMTPAALAALAGAYGDHLAKLDERASLRDVAYTASMRRTRHVHRLAVVGGSAAELSEALSAFSRGEAPEGVAVGRQVAAPPKVVFVFSGQGSQWVGMGRRLLEDEPVFRTTFESCDALLEMTLGWSLQDALAAPEASSRITETEVAQPLLFALQVALADLFKSWGIAPDAVIGHSVGEVAAAYVSGILTLEGACRLVAWRGRIMQKATGRGKMVSVALPEAEAAQAIAGYEDRLSVAAVNDPGSVVLAGDAAALDAVSAALTARGVECRPLRVNYAFHSPQLAPLQRELVAMLGQVDTRRTALAMYSTVKGDSVESQELGVEYWGKNIRETVRFSAAVEAAIRDGYRVFLEVGPHPVLAANIEQCLSSRDAEGVVAFAMRRARDERRTVRAAVGMLYAHGCSVAWERLIPNGKAIVLPTYPYQRERYWIDAPRGRFAQQAGKTRRPGHPLLGEALTSSVDSRQHFWEQRLSLEALPWIEDHQVQGAPVFPGAGYVEMALAAAKEVLGAQPFVLEKLSFERMLSLEPGEERSVQMALTEEGDSSSFQIATRGPDGEWMRHAAGTVRPTEVQAPEAELPEAVLARCPTRVTVKEHYQHLDQRGDFMGPAFRGLTQLWLGEGEAVGLVRRTEAVAAQRDTYRVHPAHLDACFQALLRLLATSAPEGTYVAAALERVQWYRSLEEETWVTVRMHPSAEKEAWTFDLVLTSADGAVCAALEGLRVQRMSEARTATQEALDSCVFTVEWRDRARGQERAVDPGAWLLLVDAAGTGAALAARLRARGHTCIEVVPGDRYQQLEPSLYRIDPTSSHDYRRLLQEAFAKGKPCRGVVHLWSLDVAPFERTSGDTLAVARDWGVGSALFLAQALLWQAWRDTPRFVLVTRGAQPAGDGSVPVSAAQAPLWGLARTIALEHPALECARVDLDPAGGIEEPELLMHELFATDREDQVALRGLRRLAARLVRSTFAAVQARGVSLRGDATYLITGGLGGLGITMARWLFAQGARHLALVGRNGPSAAAQEALVALEDKGAQVLVLQADVSRAADVAEVVARVKAQMPPLKGVVHAAGVLEDRTLLELAREQLERVFAPKVQGAWNLHQATREEALDFFVMHSSAAALLGSPGQAHYAAANAFMDALAHARQKLGLPATSVQWGPFSEVGMAAALESRGQRLSSLGLGSITPEEGMRALGRVLARPRPEVGVMRLVPRQWLEFYPQIAGVPFFADLAQERASTKTAAARPGSFRVALERAAQEAKLPLLEAHVLAQIAQVTRLDVARIDRRASFTGLGVDSLMSLELRNRLESSMGVKLAVTVLFTYPSPAALLGHLATLVMPASKPEVSTLPAATSMPAMFSASAEEPAAPPADDDLLQAFDQSLREINDQKLR